MTGSDARESLSEDSDESLLSAIAERSDRAAFAELFSRFAGRIKAFLIKSGAPADQAEEIAQEVMVTVWRRAETFDAARASAVTWIFTIARNRRIDALRRAARPEPDVNDPLFQPEPQPDPAHALAAMDRDSRIRKALTGLAEDQMVVIRLAFYAGLSHAEIAAELELPLGTVKSRLRLAFARLRKALGDEFSMELVDD